MKVPGFRPRSKGSTTPAAGLAFLPDHGLRRRVVPLSLVTMCNPVTVFNPDRLLLADVYRGYEYEVTCNSMAVRCGYVRVPAWHPWHGVSCWDLDARAHGGVNFSAPDVNCGKGGADDAWWFGFDCGHAWDAYDPALPGYEAFAEIDRILQRYNDDGWRTVKSLGYVARECRRLILQADYAARTLPRNRRLELV